MSRTGAHTAGSILVRQWAASLQLGDLLSSLLPPDLSRVADLSSEQIQEVCRIFSEDLSKILHERCLSLKSTLSINNDRKMNSKFSTFEGNFGDIKDFHKSFYEDIGNPHPQWEKAMCMEHSFNTDDFYSRNYDIHTSPSKEWEYVVNNQMVPPDQMGHGRMLKSLGFYMDLEVTRSAGLRRPEVIALVLYTGPMFMVWNTVLRKSPVAEYERLKSKNSLFSTSIFVLISAIQKIARVMKLQPREKLYRGVDGAMELPTKFSTADAHGCIGMMEFGFMSTTREISVAVSYTGVSEGKAHPRVFEVEVGSVDRGADISQYSQYPAERELLWAPHCFLEPSGGDELVVTQHGVVEVVKVRVNSNLKAVTLEDYESRKKDLHLNSFKFILEHVQHDLEEAVTSGIIWDSKKACSKDIKERERFAAKCMEQCTEVLQRHASRPVTEYNDDGAFRLLVMEMMDVKNHALVKMSRMMSLAPTDEEFWIDKPLKVTFRDALTSKVSGLRMKSSPDEALSLCKLYGLVADNVSEVNELGETALVATCADLCTDARLLLLIKAGSDVNFTLSYPGLLRKGMTPLLTASVYGYNSMITELVKNGADVNVLTAKGESGINLAAGFGHGATIELLVKLGSRHLNTPDSDGRTPLYKVASFGHTAACEMLLNLGADPSIDCQGWTPMDVAAHYKKKDVIDVFKKRRLKSVKYPNAM